RRDAGVASQIGVAHQGPNARPPVGELFHLVQRQAVDVDDLSGCLDIQLHQVHQRGAPCYKTRLAGRAGGQAQGRLDIVGTGVLEAFHDGYRLPRTCWIAATMLLYAPQRHMLPLINSRTSSSWSPQGSSSRAAADMICPAVQ